MGVQLEFLKRFDEAIQTYNKCSKFIQENYGEKHELYDKIRDM